MLLCHKKLPALYKNTEPGQQFADVNSTTTLQPKTNQLCEKFTTNTAVRTRSAGVQDDISAMTTQLFCPLSNHR
jgi:hypothetical protein